MTERYEIINNTIAEMERLRAENERLREALTAAWHALESYARDNGSPELAIEIAAYCKTALDGVPFEKRVA